jgi:methylmalonyl-CoA mutase N-terminal domain/subunit
VKVGVNAFVAESESPIETLVIGPDAERRQVAALRLLRGRRDATDAEVALQSLREAARTDVNLIEPLVECARRRCTEGEIVRALIEVFGEYRETPRF